MPKIRLVYLTRHERHRQLVSIRSKRVDRRYQLIKPILILKFFPTNLPSTLLQKNINADAARIESADSHHFLLSVPPTLIGCY